MLVVSPFQDIPDTSKYFHLIQKILAFDQSTSGNEKVILKKLQAQLVFEISVICY